MEHFGKRVLILAASVCSTAAIAADFDGSEALICSFGQVIECVDGVECETVSHESVDAPDFVKLDFKRKQFTAIAAGVAMLLC